jgi:cell division protein FtsB
MTRRRKFLWIAVGLAGVLLLISAVDARGFRRYFRLQREIESLEVRNRELALRNAAMVRELEALRRDPRAMERAAREELGFVKQGEVVFNLE